MNQSDQLAREERAAASTVDLGATRWVLIAAVVVLSLIHISEPTRRS